MNGDCEPRLGSTSARRAVAAAISAPAKCFTSSRQRCRYADPAAAVHRPWSTTSNLRASSRTSGKRRENQSESHQQVVARRFASSPACARSTAPLQALATISLRAASRCRSGASRSRAAMRWSKSARLGAQRGGAITTS